MHYEYSTEKLLNLQGVKVENVIQTEKETEIYLDLIKKECTCPNCKAKTSKIHDYRIQRVKDVPAFSKNTILIIRKRRYVCKACGKRFYEKLDFLPKYYRISIRVIESVFEELANIVSYKQVAKKVHFEKAKLITDKYHFVRQVIWDFEKVRKNEQKKLSKKYRLTFKRSKSLLTKRFNSLNLDEIQKVKNIFRISPSLQEAHTLKETFLNILNEKDFNMQCLLLKDWLFTATAYNISDFKASIKAISNWYDSINNAFEFGYSNGFTEGCNNKIKVLKRVSFGVRNFKRFRNRILHIFNY